MSTLVLIGYDDQLKAEEVRLKLLRMQKEYLIDLEDAVVATKDPKGKVKLHQTEQDFVRPGGGDGACYQRGSLFL